MQEKLFVGKNIEHIAIYKPKDERTIYNVIYRDGKDGTYFMKRFPVTGVTRDKEYDVTQGKPGSKICYFTANSNGEAEVVRVFLKPKARLNKLQFDIDFAEMAVKGKQSRGNIVTKNEVHRFSLRERGVSTLGGRQVWFDRDVLRLNYDGRGEYLGEFHGQDLVLVVLKNGEYYTSNFDATNHYEDNILRIELFEPGKVWTAVLNDADQGYPYLKRFTFEASAKRQRFIGENPASELIALSDAPGARFKIEFEPVEGIDMVREPLEVLSPEFISVKSFKAKGKRLTTFSVASITELEPAEVELPETEPEDVEATEVTDESPEVEPEISDDELRDTLNGQERLFD